MPVPISAYLDNVIPLLNKRDMCDRKLQAGTVFIYQNWFL